MITRFFRRCMGAGAIALILGLWAASPPALAVEVEDGATGLHCDPTCVAHMAAQEIDIYAHIPFFGEVHQYACSSEQTLSTDEDGEGVLIGISFFGGLSSPNPCDDISVCVSAWGFHIRESAGLMYLIIAACIDTPLTTCEGDLAVELQVNSSNEATRAEATGQQIEGTVCSIDGDWTMEEDIIVDH